MVTPPELRGYVGSEESWVATCDVHVGVTDVHEAVQHVYKLLQLLHLVYNDIIWVAVCNQRPHMVQHFIGIAKFLIDTVFQRYLNDVVFADTFVNQVFVKEVVSKNDLPQRLGPVITLMSPFCLASISC